MFSMILSIAEIAEVANGSGFLWQLVLKNSHYISVFILLYQNLQGKVFHIRKGEVL